MKRTLCLLALALTMSGCYHATVSTGLRAGAETIETPWAHGWIYGLVPPSAIDTMDRCPAGVARVDTQLSFVNQLVSMLTFGIYTPMEIIVTCAAGREDGVPEATSAAEAQRYLESGETFLVAW